MWVPGCAVRYNCASWPTYDFYVTKYDKSLLVHNECNCFWLLISFSFGSFIVRNFKLETYINFSELCYLRISLGSRQCPIIVLPFNRWKISTWAVRCSCLFFYRWTHEHVFDSIYEAESTNYSHHNKFSSSNMLVVLNELLHRIHFIHCNFRDAEECF